jgi:uncharacterized RDD family membrane protein YckC
MSVSPSRLRVERLQGRRAGIVSRISANAIDFVTIFLLYVGLLGAYAVVDYLATSGDFHMPDPPPEFHAIAIVVVQIVYLAFGWSGTTRSVGKEVMGLRVVDTKARPLTLRRGFVRSVVCTFIGEPLLLWAAVSKRNAAVYDLFLHTAVIHDWRSPAKVLAAAGRLVSCPRQRPPPRSFKRYPHLHRPEGCGRPLRPRKEVVCVHPSDVRSS